MIWKRRSGGSDRSELLIDCLARPARLGELAPEQWDRLIPQAREARLLATLEALLAEQGGQGRAPGAARDHLRGAGLAAQRRADALEWELSRLVTELPGGLAAPPLLLKGAAYLAAGLPHARTRHCADIDLLVARTDLERVERMLFWAGWQPAGLDAYDERYYREWMHQLPPLQHRRRGSTLDLHHNILPATARRPPDPRLLLDRAVATPGLPGLTVPAPAHLAIHCAVHLLADTEWDKAVRDFHDLDRILRHYGAHEGDAFWQELVGEAVRLRCERPVDHAVRHVQARFGTPVPPAVAAALARRRPAAPVAGLMVRAVDGASRPCAGGEQPRRTRAWRALLFVRAHWLRMPPLLLLRHVIHKARVARAEGP